MENNRAGLMDRKDAQRRVQWRGIIIFLFFAAFVFVAATMAFETPVVEALPVLTTTPTPPVFSAIMSIEPDRSVLFVGETLTLVVDIHVSEGCKYPVFDLMLRQKMDEAPIFIHVDPPEDTIGPGVTIPSVWTFRATEAGTATFHGQAYGERYCGDAWAWQYVSGNSATVTVLEAVNVTDQVWLPTVVK